MRKNLLKEPNGEKNFEDDIVNIIQNSNRKDVLASYRLIVPLPNPFPILPLVIQPVCQEDDDDNNNDDNDMDYILDGLSTNIGTTPHINLSVYETIIQGTVPYSFHFISLLVLRFFYILNYFN